MATSREIVCREFKKSEKLFLNYESQNRVELGEIIIWHGRKACFDVVTHLKDLGVNYRIKTSSVKSTQLFNSRSGVKMGFKVAGRTGNPTMEFQYKGASRYSIQAFDTSIESIDAVDLATHITNALKAGTLEWEKEWIVVTTVWNAIAYTKLVSGSKDAEAGVCANPGLVSSAFNIADINLGVNLGYSNKLCSQEIASTGACPFFIGMKYRPQRGKIPHMVRFGN